MADRAAREGEAWMPIGTRPRTVPDAEPLRSLTRMRTLRATRAGIRHARTHPESRTGSDGRRRLPAPQSEVPEGFPGHRAGARDPARARPGRFAHRLSA